MVDMVNQNEPKIDKNCDQYSDIFLRKSSLIPPKYMIRMLAFSFAVFCRGRTRNTNSDVMHLLLYYNRIKKIEVKIKKNQIYDNPFGFISEITSIKQELRKYHNSKSKQNTYQI